MSKPIMQPLDLNLSGQNFVFKDRRFATIFNTMHQRYKTVYPDKLDYALERTIVDAMNVKFKLIELQLEKSE